MVKKVIKRLSFLSLICMVLVSCSSGDMGILLDLAPNNQTNVVKIDTLTVNTSTVKLDSIITSGSGTMLVGKTNQINFGQIASTAYFQMGIPSMSLANMDGVEKLVYDSLLVVLKYAGSIGDTTVRQTISANALTSLPSETKSKYSTMVLESEAKALGTKTFVPHPSSDTAVNIKLSDILGNQLFEYLKQNATIDITDILKMNKGISLNTTSTQNSAIVKFSAANSYIALYTHNTSTKAAYTVKTPLRLGITQFNSFNYLSYYNGINSLTKPLMEIDSKKTDNQSFVYSGIGFGSKVHIPYIQNLKFIPNFYLVNKVELEVYAVRKSLKDYQIAPSTLNLFAVNNSNQIIGLVSSYSGTAVASSYLLSSDQLIFSSLYKFDITSYFQQLVNGTVPNKGFLISLPVGSDTGATINGIALGNAQNTNYQLRLKIYYTQGG